VFSSILAILIGSDERKTVKRTCFDNQKEKDQKKVFGPLGTEL